jgi:hypothetical protein
MRPALQQRPLYGRSRRRQASVPKSHRVGAPAPRRSCRRRGRAVHIGTRCLGTAPLLPCLGVDIGVRRLAAASAPSPWPCPSDRSPTASAVGGRLEAPGPRPGLPWRRGSAPVPCRKPRVRRTADEGPPRRRRAAPAGSPSPAVPLPLPRTRRRMSPRGGLRACPARRLCVAVGVLPFAATRRCRHSLGLQPQAGLLCIRKCALTGRSHRPRRAVPAVAVAVPFGSEPDGVRRRWPRGST